MGFGRGWGYCRGWEGESFEWGGGGGQGGRARRCSDGLGWLDMG